MVVTTNVLCLFTNSKQIREKAFLETINKQRKINKQPLKSYSPKIQLMCYLLEGSTLASLAPLSSENYKCIFHQK